MDAAHNLRKLALFLAVALLCAGAASAAVTVSPSIVSLSSAGGAAASFQVNSDAAGTAYTVAVTSSDPFFTITSTGSGVTPGTVTISRLKSCNFGLSTCPDGTITVTGGGGTATVTVQDAGNGGGGGGTSVFYTASPNPVNLTASNGFATSGLVTVTSSTATADTLNVSVSPAGTWLSVLPTSAVVSNTSPGYFQINANSAVVAPNQTYSGTVTFTGTNGTLQVPVNFTVGSGSVTGSLSVSAGSVGLSYPCGTCSTSVSVTSTSASSFTASSNANWLLVNGNYTTGTLAVPSNLAISVNTFAAASLATGTQTGTITLTPNSGTATTISVSLTVNGGSGGGTGTFASPSSLTFAYQIGKAAPLPQTVWLSGNDTYTIESSGRVFANVTTVTGPGSFTAQPTVFGAAAGTSNGTITVTSNTTGAQQTIPTTLLVADNTAPVIAANVGSSSLGDIVCTQQSGCTVSVAVTASDNSVVPLTVSASNTWIVVSNAPASTPGTFTVQLVPTGLSGVNNGSITISGTGAANTVTIPVVLALSGTNPGTGSLTLSTSSVNFTAGGVQYVTLNSTTGAATAFTAALGSTGCSWLSLSVNQYFTPATLTLSAVNPGVAMSCNITLTANGQAQTLTVTFNGGGGGGTGTGTITASKMTVDLTAQSGGTPAAQTVTLTGSGSAALPFTVTTYGLGNRITVTPTGGTTPATLSITANTAGLEPGVYTDGYIQVSSMSGYINVRLTITAATVVSATPTSLTFDYSAGGSIPASKKIQVTGVAANLPFSATVTSGSDWLSVSPASGTAGTTATDLTVSVNPTTLQANKTYTGTIVVAGTGSATGSTTITVTLNVSAPLPTVSRVTNAASFNTGSVSAGEIITIFGTAIGPQQLQVAAPSNGQYPTELAGVQVTVGGYLAPLIYVRSDQVSAIVPYEINRPVFVANAPVVVRYLGQGSNGLNVQQAAAAPGIFTVGGGTGQAAALNQNLSVNSVNNPANKGDVIVLYATGEGQTSPAGVTGRVTGTPIPTPVSGQVTVTIDGVPAQVLFAGEAPGLVSGVMQVNAVIPNGLTRSGDVPVVVSVGGTKSQVDAAGVGLATIAIR